MYEQRARSWSTEEKATTRRGNSLARRRWEKKSSSAKPRRWLRAFCKDRTAKMKVRGKTVRLDGVTAYPKKR